MTLPGRWREPAQTRAQPSSYSRDASVPSFAHACSAHLVLELTGAAQQGSPARQGSNRISGGPWQARRKRMPAVPTSKGDRANRSQVVRLWQAPLWKYREHIQLPAESWASPDDTSHFQLPAKFCLYLSPTPQGNGPAHLYRVEKNPRSRTGL